MKLIQLMTARYRAFLVDHLSLLNLTVEVLGDRSLFETNLNINGAAVQFNSPGIKGAIDFESQSGNITLDVKRPFEAVDYCLRVVYSILAYRSGGILLHAAGIVKNAQAYLFTGHSGSGKTTIALVSEDASVLNDDLVMLLKNENKWLVYGTPFWNPTQVKPNHGHALLGGIYFLVQDKIVFLEVPSYGQALAEIISNVPVISVAPEYANGLICLGSKILGETSYYRLHFLPDSSFWELVCPGELINKSGIKT